MIYYEHDFPGLLDAFCFTFWSCLHIDLQTYIAFLKRQLKNGEPLLFILFPSLQVAKLF